VVESSSPVHCNVRLLRPPCRQLAELKQAIKHRAVLTNRQWALTSLHLLAELAHVVWPYGSEELDVVVAVVLGHLVCSGFVWPLKGKHKQTQWTPRQGEQQHVMSHPDAMWLHGMALSIVIISYITLTTLLPGCLLWKHMF
uniref:Uncharacterized protein n=1 Tax=Fundulus heteroclitus TaxID=8078 RepID=A0A3Q2PRS8_FUNHE